MLFSPVDEISVSSAPMNPRVCACVFTVSVVCVSEDQTEILLKFTADMRTFLQLKSHTRVHTHARAFTRDQTRVGRVWFGSVRVGSECSHHQHQYFSLLSQVLLSFWAVIKRCVPVMSANVSFRSCVSVDLWMGIVRVVRIV